MEQSEALDRWIVTFSELETMNGRAANEADIDRSPAPLGC
jgi:hypothetical protein